MDLQRHGSILAKAKVKRKREKVPTPLFLQRLFTFYLFLFPCRAERYPSFITTRAGNATAGRVCPSSSIGKRGLNGQFSWKNKKMGGFV
jgi:hypothetical protein